MAKPTKKTTPKNPADALRAALSAAQKLEAGRADVKVSIEKLFADFRKKADEIRADHEAKITQVGETLTAAAVDVLGDKAPQVLGEKVAIVIPSQPGFIELVVSRGTSGFEVLVHEHPTAVLL